jgi:hypothetical protein
VSEAATEESVEEVWQFVQDGGTNVNATVVAAYDDVVEDLLTHGLSPQNVSNHIVLSVRRSLTSFQSNLEAFEIFCECLNFAAGLSDKVPTQLETLAHIVKTKAGLATFYDEMARMAPLAGIEDVDQEATAKDKAEAIAERDDILAKIAAQTATDAAESKQGESE